MPKSLPSTAWALAVAAMVAAPTAVLAFPSYYDSNCSACHGTTTAGGVQTCAGCHSHGTHPTDAKSSIDITGVTDKTTYAPGEMVSVTIDGGYRAGWVRALLYDQNLHELARSTGSVLPGFFAPCCGAGFPITLRAPAPTTPGTYTWWAAWYGNQYDASGAAFGPNWTPSSNPGHGEERVQTNSFTVSAPTAPTLALNPSALSFGTVNTGASSSLTTAVQNTGSGPLTVSAIARCAGTSPDFSWSPAAPFTVQPGQSATLTVTFTPSDASVDAGCIAISSNDTATPVANLSVSGTGATPPAPAIALNPSTLDFGTVAAGSSATLASQVQDTGTSPLTVSSITPCAGTSSAFTWSPPAPFTVAAGGSTALSVTYAPTGATSDGGCLTVASDDPLNPTVNLTVSGNGAVPTAPAIAFSPPTLDFGTLTIGNTRQLTAQIQNGGNAPLTVSAVALCSGTPPEYTWSIGLPATVAPGQSTAIVVTFAPTDSGIDSGCLAVSSDDPAKPVANLALTAQGAPAPTPAVALSPASLDFMGVAVGSSSSLASQVANGGGATLTVSAVSLCSGTSTEFTWAPQAPFTVPVGQAQALTVTYAPVDAGPDNGCLALTTDDPLHPTVNLGVAGSGTTTQAFPAIALSPTSLDFGTVTLGGSASRTASIQNTGNAPLDVAGIAACTGTSAEFTESPPAPFTVAPGQSQQITVTYAPVDAGQDAGCLAIASNDPMNPSVQLQVQGTGASVPVAGVDIDVDELRVPSAVAPGENSSITPVLHAKNAGKTDGSAPARLVGAIEGATVYDQTVTVTLPRGEDGEFPFPPYAVAANASGVLRWTVTIQDADPDTDMATARTRLGSGGHDEHHGDVAEGSHGATGPSGPSGPYAGGSMAGAVTRSSTLAMAGGCSSAGATGPALLALLAIPALLAGRRSRRRRP